jgi:hypothetical protein
VGGKAGSRYNSVGPGLNVKVVGFHPKLSSDWPGWYGWAQPRTRGRPTICCARRSFGSNRLPGELRAVAP